MTTGIQQPFETVIRADVEIPEHRLKLALSLLRNHDKTLPASHTVEIRTTVPAGFSRGGIANVPGLLMKDTELGRGVQLAGASVKVTSDYFLVGLSATESAMRASGADILRNAFAAWGDNTTGSSQRPAKAATGKP